jgi:hypothetical protein
VLHTFSPENGVGEFFVDRAIRIVRKLVREREGIDHGRCVLPKRSVIAGAGTGRLVITFGAAYPRA